MHNTSSPHTPMRVYRSTPIFIFRLSASPDLPTKNHMNVDLPRSCVQIPIFERTSGLNGYWAEYRIVSLTLHLGEGPHSGHYQSCLLTSGPSRVVCTPHAERLLFNLACVSAGACEVLAPAISQTSRK